MKKITSNYIKSILDAYNETIKVDDPYKIVGKIGCSRKQTGDYELWRFYEVVRDANTDSLKDLIEFFRDFFDKYEIKFTIVGTRTGWDQRNWSYDSISIFVKFHD